MGQRCLLSGGGRDVDEGGRGGRWQPLLETAGRIQLACEGGGGNSQAWSFLLGPTPFTSESSRKSTLIIHWKD